MPTEDSGKVSADLQLLDAQIQKTRAETAAIHRSAEREQHKLAERIIEGIKVLGAVVIGIGGAVAGLVASVVRGQERAVRVGGGEGSAAT
jgi:hypothetical protein